MSALARTLHAAIDDAGLPCDGDHGRGWGTCQTVAPKLEDRLAALPTITGIDAIRRALVVEMENEGVVTWGDDRHRERFLDVADRSTP